MENQCLNCESPITEQFCGNCGQKKYKRIDKKYIWEELQYTLFHANKGFLYSIKNILKNPGKTARSFIDGNRVNHYKPILLLFVLNGFSFFIAYKIIGIQEIMKTYFQERSMNSQLMQDYQTFSSSYGSFILLVLVPIFAFATKIAFRKWGHNYYEHIVMNAYILSFSTLISILIIYPLMYLAKDSETIFYQLTLSSFYLSPIILFWFFKGFYSEQKIKPIILRVLGTMGIASLLYVGVGFLVSIVGIIILLATGNADSVEYIRPN